MSCLMMTIAAHAENVALVAGGAGFIGSNLCKRLLKEGYTVYCVDNLYTGRKENISELLEYNTFFFIEHNIIHPLSLDIPLDYVFNLACPASLPHYQKDPFYTIDTSISGAKNLLALAHRNQAIYFQASTSEVYGDPEVHPQTEEYLGYVSCTGPRACYDESKRLAETLCFEHYRHYGTQIKVGRIFNTYGPKMDPRDGRVVSNFIMQALKDEPITIYGNGDQTRSFCYVDDLVEAIIRFVHTDKSIIGPINLGNDGEFTIKELATKIVAYTNSKSEISYEALPQDDPKIRKPDLTKANKYLNWQPKMDLDEGIEKTTAYFKTQ